MAESTPEPVIEPESVTIDSTLPVDSDPTFQVITGDVAAGTVGKVNADGTIYDVTFDADVAGEIEIVNKNADEKGATSLAVVRVVDGADGPEQRVELTSTLNDRIVRKGDILAVKGGKSGTVKVTIQRA